MNEFGVPMNEAEINMLPNPSKAILQEQLATSGMENQWIGAVVGAAISVVGSVIGGNKSASAARKQAGLQNEAAQRQLEYDTELWDMSKDKILADREFAVAEVEQQAANEGKIAAFKDASNLQKYNYDMKIRNREQTSLNQQYLRSDDIYNQQLTLNAMTARSGMQDELRQLQEIHAEASFDAQEQRIEQLQTEGKMRARGVSGRTAGKLGQVTYADLGTRMAMLNESLEGAGRNTKSVLKEIARDKRSADLAAFAQKMLDPGVLPTPIVPYATPMSDYLYPREIGEYDYGPEPVLGAIASPSAAANKAWGAAIPSIASGIGTGLGAYIGRFD